MEHDCRQGGFPLEQDRDEDDELHRPRRYYRATVTQSVNRATSSHKASMDGLARLPIRMPWTRTPCFSWASRTAATALPDEGNLDRRRPVSP